MSSTGRNGEFNTATQATSANGLIEPYGVALDSSGNLHVADTFNNRVLFYPAGSTTPTRVYGQTSFVTNSSGVSASEHYYPQGIAVDSSGNLWVADSYNNRVLMYAPGNTTAALVLGQTGFASSVSATTSTGFNYPTGVAVDQFGSLYVADFNNNRVLRYDNAASLANGAAATVVLVQSRFTAFATGSSASQLNGPYGLAVDNLGNLYVPELYNNRVSRYDDAHTLAIGAQPARSSGRPASA